MLGIVSSLLVDATYTKVSPELTVDVGWLCLFFVSMILLWVWTRGESLRRSLLALEDPRTMAVLRIGFALMTIQCFWNMKPYWRMLWSDEGIFLMEEARSRLGRTSLSGWNPEEGFYDLWALAKFFWSKYSFFFFKGTPEFVVAYMYAFAGVLLLYAAGVATRITGVISMVMMCSIYNRNSLYLEGTDTVYRVFWFLLIFAKTGHAWSFDNWLRCRILRRRGVLQEPGEAAEDPAKKPIYRLIPAWPRYLMMAQLVGIYTQTGLVKTGSVWARGDALYYALNMDHFYRFEVYTQQLSAVFSTNVFRVMTYVTHWWEAGFGALALGMVLKFGFDHRDQDWYREMQRRRVRVWIGRLALICAYMLVYKINIETYPYCINIGDNPVQAQVDARVAMGLGTLHAVYLIYLPVLIAVWYGLGRWPLRLWRSRQIGRVRIPGVRVDQSWVWWLIGRRTWLTLGLCFHGILILFMNIGMFPFIMLMTYAAWFQGHEFVAAGKWLLRQLRRVRWLAWMAPPQADQLMIPAQSPCTVPQRGRRVPDFLVLLSLAIGIGLVVYRVTAEDLDKELLKDYVHYWILGTFGVAAIFRFIGRQRPSPKLWRGGPALAYGTLGRTLALAAVLWHGGAIGLTLFPNYPVFSKWRGQGRAIFAKWTSGTGTSQSWRMFAPNPPRANSFMKTVVVEPDGDRWDLRNNSFTYRPFPWIWNDRMRKMHRRMIGKGKWYLKYWSAYHCRDWLLATGVYPTKIEVYKIVSRIPSPDQIMKHGWYRPRELKTKETLVETHRCPDHELPIYMKNRYGFEITDEDREQQEREQKRLVRSTENRKKAWARRRDFGGPGPKKQSSTAIAVRKARSARARGARAGG